MKSLVKPTSSIMLLLAGGEIVHSDRPSVVTVTDFVSSRIASGVLETVASGLPDTATDAQFMAYRKACRTNGKVDEPLALASFLSSFSKPETLPSVIKVVEPSRATKQRKAS